MRLGRAPGRVTGLARAEDRPARGQPIGAVAQQAEHQPGGPHLVRAGASRGMHPDATHRRACADIFPLRPNPPRPPSNPPPCPPASACMHRGMYASVLSSAPAELLTPRFCPKPPPRMLLLSPTLAAGPRASDPAHPSRLAHANRGILLLAATASRKSRKRLTGHPPLWQCPGTPNQGALQPRRPSGLTRLAEPKNAWKPCVRRNWPLFRQRQNNGGVTGGKSSNSLSSPRMT